MMQLTREARVDAETAAQELASVKNEQGILAALAKAYQDGLLAGVGITIGEKESA